MGEKSNAQRAVETLRELIFSGELPAGSDHLESEIADRLQMSRTPVREAAVTLENQGLVALRPRKGFRVLPVSADDMREIYEILTELESLAAERAAMEGYSDADLAELADSIEEMDRAIEERDLEKWAGADGRFHQELVRLSGNARLVALTTMMSDQVRRARSVTLFMRPLPRSSNDDHRKVLAAIRAGDAATARRTHHSHRKRAQALLLSLLEKHRLNRI